MPKGGFPGHGGHPLNGGDIATEALKYKGTPYVWGGYSATAGWDCSGFVNYVLGLKFGMRLPGGFVWSGRAHGPTAVMYKVWSNAHNVAQPSAGVLCVWATHIGIAVNSTQMISALDPADGTAVTTIHGGSPPGETVTYRQINHIAASAGRAQGGSVALGTPAGNSLGCIPATLMLPILVARGVLTHGHAETGH